MGDYKKKINMDTGWIKLHRKLLDNPVMKHPQYLLLWIVLLLKANHRDNRMIWNGEELKIKPGQFVTGRKELSKATNISETTVERILDYLESGHQIGQQKTTKYRLITILNWEKYQSLDNKRTTNGQQTDTNKNVKKEKKYTAKAATRNTQGQSSVKQLLEKYKYKPSL